MTNRRPAPITVWDWTEYECSFTCPHCDEPISVSAEWGDTTCPTCGMEPTPQQILWLRAFEAAGSESYLWRPSDWSSGAIIDVLGGGQAG